MGSNRISFIGFLYDASPERAYTRAQLLDQVWGGNVYIEDRTIDVHIRRLRKSLRTFWGGIVLSANGTWYRLSFSTTLIWQRVKNRVYEPYPVPELRSS